MKLLLTGVTGVAGLAIYRRAVEDPEVTHITLLTRRPVPDWAVLPATAAAKTTTLIHSDFSSFPPELAKQLAENDACVWALGRSSLGMSEEEYTATTYTSVMNAARALKEAGVGAGRSADAPFRFVYISGEGADQTGRSRQMWANVKGRTERDLIEFCKDAEGMQARIYRPGYFFPSKNNPEDRTNQRSATLGVVDNVMTPVLKCVMPSVYTRTEDLSTFAVELAKGRWPETDQYRNADMHKLVKDVQ
ncbi:hypothetical protein DAEQUDRAFT_725345 [Daedalea quercina L-15889]|uniref:NAD(P)-binding domain-containing protein n=1 Tax=Daedalea quercina L-15889 TaxID=1314783 RepID=A0A165R8I6_9APHY|nr:hypothetical protein DAEQUDRAFT_725345 [Daedalea quercina L-15889]